MKYCTYQIPITRHGLGDELPRTIFIIGTVIINRKCSRDVLASVHVEVACGVTIVLWCYRTENGGEGAAEV